MLGLAGPALADAACTRPEAPAPVDGTTATMEQLLAAKAAVTTFITASDAYQTCVLDDLEARKKAAKAARAKLDPAVAKAADAGVSENQVDKERVGQAFNTAAKAYKAAHPS
ncbi:hypothetical protein [Phenylobacterium sp.]|uniref:hypothetical protein n=1 Tax=Phenylobacterium sp. TaxID=1871053 RepID=UPI002F40788D